MAIEISSDKVVCSRCGKMFGKRRGNFSVSYASMYKGIGYLTVCKPCIEEMYSSYLSQCNDAKLAVRQMCRKLDLFWDPNVFDSMMKQSTSQTVMLHYLNRVNTVSRAGKSYDDTLSTEGTLWKFDTYDESDTELESDANLVIENTDEADDISEDIKLFWGSGYSSDAYRELEQRRASWVASLPADAVSDAGTDALIRQICSLEMDINKARASGRSVDKSVTALNTLIGSITKMQKKQDDTDSSMADTPLGVWLYRYENMRPLPEIDDDLKDVNHVRRYVFTWMGHLCKMLGLKNGYTRMYEDEIAKLRVDKPEYDGDDDEAFYAEVMMDEPPGTEVSDTG